jgi:peptidoglycan hydrolase-like protein with peptidoglycan-binding domain
MRPGPLSWVGRTAIAVAAAVILAACGGSTASITQATRPTPVATSSAQAQTPSPSPSPSQTNTVVDQIDTSIPEPDSPVAGVETIVLSLQLALQQLGYQPGQVDGVFATTTQAALKRFQAAKRITTNERGALGPATAAALAASGAGTVVQALQSALTDVGLFDGTINGVYDGATVEAVKALQTKAQIQPDGFYGPNTATALASLYSKADPEPIADAGPAPEAGSDTDAPGLLKLGSSGAAVTKLQQRLATLGYRPGPSDGTFGAATASAVLAFQKRNGLTRDSVVGPGVERALEHPAGAGPKAGPLPRIDIDIARQIILVVLKQNDVITLNTSTGNNERYSVPGGGTDVAYTPVGNFTVLRKIAGNHNAPLGTLRNPLYFYKGWAIHGAANVPAYPASHGCARISNADADWLYPQIPVGTPVNVYDTTGKSPSVGSLASDAAPGY